MNDKEKMRRANTNNKNNNNRTRKRPPPPFLPPPSIIGDDIIAGRTRRQKRAIASKWDLQTPIIIEIISWLDQESLMNMNVVSKQLYDIITTNEPGNKNEIHPIFEVSGSSALKFYQNLQNYFFEQRDKEQVTTLPDYEVQGYKQV